MYNVYVIFNINNNINIYIIFIYNIYTYIYIYIYIWTYNLYMSSFQCGNIYQRWKDILKQLHLYFFTLHEFSKEPKYDCLKNVFLFLFAYI